MTYSFNSNSLSEANSLTDDPILELLGINSDQSVADQDAIATLAYSAPEAPLNPQLKQELFQSLGLSSPRMTCMVSSIFQFKH